MRRGLRRLLARPRMPRRAGLAAEDLVASSRARLAEVPRGRDRLLSTLLGASFLAAALVLALVAGASEMPALGTVSALVAAYVVAGRVQFEVGTGAVVPTEVVLVPMFFVLPAAWVPLAVGAALALDHVLDVLLGRASLGRIAQAVGNGWHAIGPALVLTAAGDGPPELGRWPLYAGALAAQFAFDLAAMVVRDWLVLGVPPRDELEFVPTVYLVDVALAPVGLLAAIAARETRYAFLLVMPLLGILTVFARERRARIDKALELSTAYRGTALLLGDVVEADDAYTGDHCRDVVSLTVAVGAELGLAPGELRRAELVALLHDVGKIRVPKEIINKPGPLTAEEREIVERHTVDGQAMLERVGGLLAEVGGLVRSHHERWDGAGYPDGLAGDAIPVISRIVAVCDAYNAMTTTRSYRRALPSATALAELRANAGTQFDPAVVNALAAVVSRTGSRPPVPALRPAAR